MSPHIFIVDDNPTNLKLAVSVLEGAGCQVTKATDAEEAQSRLATTLPDIILMDIALPGMDGLTLTRKLKMEDRFRRIPIVALTASAMKGDDEKALAAGCQGYITKPIDTRRFVRQVLAFLPSDMQTVPTTTKEPTGAPRMPMSILIVDDSNSNRKLLHAGLEHEGHTVLEAANGREALQVLEREHVDAVISDVLMPMMDGFRLCREIRRCAKSYASLPLLLYTSTYDSPADRELAIAVGADDYVLKPAPIAIIVQALHEAREKVRAKDRSLSPAPGEADVLEQYNAALVRKLETRNGQLQQALIHLKSTHEQLLELNRHLEMRVEQRTAALDAANKELESFSYSVAHDLRAPLRQISGYTDLLKISAAKHSSTDEFGLFNKIVSAAERMDQLITDLLAFARTAREDLTLNEVSLDTVTDEALHTLYHEIQGRDVQWKREPLPKVRGDPVLLRQVYVNLISNAIKYTRPRSPAVIEIGYRPGRTNEIVLFVRDNGVGFDMRHAGHLFGVFQRLHKPAEFEGSGIGLANVQRIIARHGGRIWAEAAVDRGATFYFTLPPATAPQAGV